ncbi:MAG TPA: retropepsin-like aspartic protease, partial [Oculatellaceae cyanobacterium]
MKPSEGVRVGEAGVSVSVEVKGDSRTEGMRESAKADGDLEEECVCATTHDGRVPVKLWVATCEAHVRGSQTAIRATLDTAATTSVTNESFVKWVQAQGLIIQSISVPIGTAFRTAGKEPVVATRKVKLQLLLGPKEDAKSILQDFFVLPSTPGDILLGIDFLVQQKAVINFGDSTLTLAGLHITLPIATHPYMSILPSLQPQPLYCCQNEEFPSGIDMGPYCLRASQYGPLAHATLFGWIRPLPEVYSLLGLLPAKGLAQMKRGVVRVLFMNATPQLIHANEGAPVALFYPANPEDFEVMELQDEASTAEGKKTTSIISSYAEAYNVTQENVICCTTEATETQPPVASETGKSTPDQEEVAQREREAFKAAGGLDPKRYPRGTVPSSYLFYTREQTTFP